MGVDNFGNSYHDPNHKRAEVHLEKQRSGDHWDNVEKIFDGMKVFGSNTDIRFELMVLFVYVFVPVFECEARVKFLS